MAKQKSWREKLAKANPAHVVRLEKPFAGVPAGCDLYIPSPSAVAAYLKSIPAGETRPVETIRADLARGAGAHAACPVATSYALRIAAEAALEDLRDGRPDGEVTPFWRGIAPGTPLSRKLSCGDDDIAHRRAMERQEGTACAQPPSGGAALTVGAT